MTRRVRLLLLLFVTATYAGYLQIIARQYTWIVSVILLLPIVAGVSYLLRWRLREQPWIPRLLAGFALGYVASIVALAGMVIATWGFDQFSARFFGESLVYVYPAVSFGWLYGMAFVALFCSEKNPD